MTAFTFQAYPIGKIGENTNCHDDNIRLIGVLISTIWGGGG